MKIRQAIKICRAHHGWPPVIVWHKPTTIWKARAMARRREMDLRFPIVPSDEEMAWALETLASLMLAFDEDEPPKLVQR